MTLAGASLAAERARFWASALYYYRGMQWGRTYPYVADAWEQAKEDLLAAVEREREQREGRLSPLPASFTGECPACGEKQEGNEVCAECVAIWGGAKAAMAAARGLDQHRCGPKAGGRKHGVELVCAMVRQHLGRYGALNVATFSALHGMCRRTVLRALHRVAGGEDGDTPMTLIEATGRGQEAYWRVADGSGQMG